MASVTAPSAAEHAGSVAPPAAVPVKNVSVGMATPGLNYLPHRIAQAMGYYREAGFDVEIQIMQANALLAGIAAGGLSFGDSGGSAIRAAASGLPVRLVECHGTRPFYYIALARGLDRVQDLEGNGLAISAVGSDTHVIARDLVRKVGGNPDAVQYLALGASDVRFAALESGRVAGAILSIMEGVQALEANLTIVNSADDLPFVCNLGTVVSDAAIAERPQEIRRFIQAIQRAVDFMKSDRARSAALLAEWQGISPAQAEQAYDLSSVEQSFATDRASAQRAIAYAIAFAQESGLIGPAVQVADVADLSLYP